jgi:nuclear pore complex protein Nup98-Nup96
MSFGSGFGGFGSNTQSSGFGGFGSNNQPSSTGNKSIPFVITSNTSNYHAQKRDLITCANSSGGFGATGSGFGTNTNTGSGLFGGTSGTFGSGGFGSSSASPFNQNKTGFGSTTTTSGGSLFSGTTATSGGFGGFGGSSTGFGGGSGTSGNLFGQNKPAFGSGSGTGVFGGGSSTGFGGASTSTPAFGGGSTSSFGANPQNNGTGSIPFQPVEEKDLQGGGKNQYWSITCMDPYKAFSFEELRLVDYAQGRKHGNASGQAGAFGSTTGFGSFGSGTGTAPFGSSTTGGGLFGAQNTSSPFGQPSTGSGFGGASNTTLFGGARPATSSLFGGTTTTSGQTGSNLFATSGTAFGGSGGGFGSGSGGSNVFGQQTQQQNKPTFGFGSGTTGGGFGSSTGGGFGSTTASSGGLFGSNTATASPFGQSGGTAFGGFGQQNQQQQGQTGSNIFGGFGANTQAQQQKPNLFGGTAATTTPNLFGGQQNQPQTTGSNLFGGSGTQQSNTLFGGNKSATSSVFGGTGATGSNLFGNTQQQQQPSGGLFSQPNQQQSTLFGKPATGLGSSLFGQSTAQQPAASTLFGGSQQQQQQQPTLGSVFSGTTVQPQQQQQAQQPLNASSIAFPYGAPSLFMDVPSPNQNPGPIATPLSTSQKSRKQAIIPAYRINPNASSRLITPQKRPQGYGFSYSTYGTPGSAYGSSPIGLGSSLLGSSIGRSLGKSYSSSNLRNSYTAQDSLLVPGAFPSNSRSGTGSMKKLNVNRNINTRRSLFDGDINDTPNQGSLRKQVSFDSGAKQINGAIMKENGLNGVNGALVRRESPERELEPAPNVRSDSRPEMEQVNNNNKGKELAVISEDGPPPMATKTSLSDAEKARLTQKDQKPGDYWMNPSIEKIEKMSREERSHIKNLTIGRIGCGQIVFSEVDLNNFPLNKILDNIVKIDIRRATVYGDDTPITKPSPGSGLNVPSTITLENSWPRASAGRLPVFEKHGERFNKHLRRLQRVEGTEFVSYDDKSGRWTFKVEHYTTYGLDYDDDESVLSSSMLSEIAPPTPTPTKVTPRPTSNDARQTSPESSMLSPPESSPDDTFEFKKGKRKNLPGQFDEQDMDILEDETMMDGEDGMATPQSFLEERSSGSPVVEADHAIAITATEEFEPELEKEMAGAFPKLAATVEHDDTALDQSPSKLKSILKTNDATGTPYKTARIDVDDWTEQLQRTVSPKKLNRQDLKDMQATILMEHYEPKFVPTSTTGEMGFETSIDLMNSLFGSTTRGKRPGEIINGMEVRV